MLNGKDENQTYLGWDISSKHHLFQNPAQRPKNGPPSSQTASYQKTEVTQSYLRIWWTYGHIESDPSDPKKWGLYGCSVKKYRFPGQKCSFLAQNPFFSEIVQIFCHHHDWTPKRQHFCVDPVARRASGAHFWP